MIESGARLVDSAYGKVGVRLAKVERDGEWHRFHDLTLRLSLSGDFSAAYAGDNSTSLPTDTMRSAAYVVAQDVPLAEVEVYAEALLRRLLASTPVAVSARAEVVAHRWDRLVVDGAEHPHGLRAAAAVDTAQVVVHRDGPLAVTSGLDDLVLCKTTGSEYRGFIVDDVTVLPEAADRILATAVQASWTWNSVPDSYASVRVLAQSVFERVFAIEHSLSVQHTVFRMGEAFLAAAPEVAEVSFVLPNRHHVPVDLTRFGRTNANEVFTVLDRPYGLIEATVRRT